MRVYLAQFVNEILLSFISDCNANCDVTLLTVFFGDTNLI